MQLTEQQLAFLDRNLVPASKTFDAQGYRARDYKQLMSERFLWVAYNVTPCREYGHTLRTRKGHCAQCNPLALKRLREHDEPGEVYVAYSRKRRLVKIGCAQHSPYRVSLLNDEWYAMTNDWVLKHYMPTQSAGRVEAAVHSTLALYAVPCLYLKAGQVTRSRETFRTTLKLAIEVVKYHLAESPA